VDTVITYEPEGPLVVLLRELENRTVHLGHVPNLIYREGDRIRRNPVMQPIAIDEFPLPDFSDHPRASYLSPFFVIPVASGRGCYWHQCAYCDEYYGVSVHTRERNSDRLAGEMERLHRTYGSPFFRFANTFTTARQIDELSVRLKEKGLDLRWYVKTRIEAGLTREILQEAYEAGCRMINVGIESGSPRVLTLMNKGISLEECVRLLRDSSDCGLWTHCYFLFRFPGEELADAMQTRDFIRTNKRFIHSTNLNIFNLRKRSPLESSGRLGRLTDFCVHKDLPHDAADDWPQYSQILTELKELFPFAHRCFPKDHHFLTICHEGRTRFLQSEAASRGDRPSHAGPCHGIDPENRVRLAEGVCLGILKHADLLNRGVPGTRLAESSSALFLRRFHELRWDEAVIPVSPDVRALLEFCGSGPTIAEVMEQIPSEGDTPAGAVRAGVMNRLHELIHGGILEVMPKPSERE
jgi:hypothetical protein